MLVHCRYHIMLAGLQPVLSRMYPLQTCLSDFNVACLLRWVQHVVENFGFVQCALLCFGVESVYALIVCPYDCMSPEFNFDSVDDAI